APEHLLRRLEQRGAGVHSAGERVVDVFLRGQIPRERYAAERAGPGVLDVRVLGERAARVEAQHDAAGVEERDVLVRAAGRLHAQRLVERARTLEIRDAERNDGELHFEAPPSALRSAARRFASFSIACSVPVTAVLLPRFAANAGTCPPGSVANL